ncbi:hypothetical protein LSAT2_007185 [Lamellibrachia satsuma]|nr:hypothetical protein LSAT2_007185 [Lamellibrachia satsuma]
MTHIDRLVQYHRDATLKYSGFAKFYDSLRNYRSRRNYCISNGKCEDVFPAFQCKKDADCLNNGKCTNCSPGFKATCDCALGYIGANCAFKYTCNKKMCSTSRDCLNGGTCHGNVCHCRGHFFGDHCETESASTTETTVENETTVESTTEQTTPMFPNCSTSSDCHNAGTCHENVCHCTDQYIGDHCETVFKCMTNADCLNSGTCPAVNNGACDCTPGFVGANCALKYSCNTRNPCFKANTDVNGFYYEQSDPHKYIQCTAGGRCFDMSCGTLVYKPATRNCGFAK